MLIFLFFYSYVELDEIADEINESHDLFEQQAKKIKDKKYN